MTYTAEINVMPLKELLDPQGKAVNSGLKNLGITEAKDVRIGKHITIKIDAASPEQAKRKSRTRLQKVVGKSGDGIL